MGDSKGTKKVERPIGFIGAGQVGCHTRWRGWGDDAAMTPAQRGACGTCADGGGAGAWLRLQGRRLSRQHVLLRSLRGAQAGVQGVRRHAMRRQQGGCQQRPPHLHRREASVREDGTGGGEGAAQR